VSVVRLFETEWLLVLGGAGACVETMFMRALPRCIKRRFGMVCRCSFLVFSKVGLPRRRTFSRGEGEIGVACLVFIEGDC